MSEMMDFNLTQFLVAVCSLVITWVLTRVGKTLDKKATAEAGKNNMEAAKTAYETLSGVCSDVVQYMNSTMVNDLKSAASDGKLTTEESEMIFKSAYQHIASTLSDDIKSTIQTHYGDVEKVITRQIEVYVDKNKSSFLTPLVGSLVGETATAETTSSPDTATPTIDAATTVTP